MYHFLFFVLSYDLWFYISHRFLHTPMGYKWIHRYHHSVEAKKLNYSDTYVAHIFEGPIQSAGVLFPLYFIPLNIHTLIVVALFLNIRGMLRHDIRMTWLVGNYHVLHHKYPLYNFGDLWLDWLMGTHYPDFKEYTFGMIYA